MIFSLFAQLNVWQSFVVLFSEMSWYVTILFILGILLMMAETFVPGIGVFGISGFVCFVASVIIRMAEDGNVYMFIYMLIIAILLVGGCFFFVARSIKKGKLKKSIVFDVGTAVPEGITEGTKDFTYLLGKVGKTTTFLRPVGVADFDGDTVDVVAKNGFIDSDTSVKVVAVEGQKISVVVYNKEDK